jgi:hypothetical protein
LLEGLLNGIAKVMGWIFNKLPGFNIDSTELTNGINFLKPKLEIADKIFPIKETIAVLSILVSWSLVMLVFWAAQRLINLLRGAG